MQSRLMEICTVLIDSSRNQKRGRDIVLSCISMTESTLDSKMSSRSIPVIVVFIVVILGHLGPLFPRLFVFFGDFVS
jgi:hypothetical protein